MDKKKTHSTQKKYFGTIPRSEFYGFVLGYAVGLILTGALRLDSQFQTILTAVIGFGIGWIIDKKYFQEPDEPEVLSSGEPDTTGPAEMQMVSSDQPDKAGGGGNDGYPGS